MKLEGEIALITGAGSGIGRAMARLFAAEGARVICVDNSGWQDAVAAGIGAAATPVQCDVADSGAMRALFEQVEGEHGRLDILCNNAGISGPYLPLHQQEESTFDRVMAVNVKGLFLGMKYGIDLMLRTGGGCVVNTASVAGLVGWKDLSLYSATKGAVVQMTKAAALDYAGQGIRVNAICPGATWTGMVPGADGVAHPDPGFEAPGTPLGRWGMPEDMAPAALLLASGDASFVTGAIWTVDGGYTAI